MTWRPRISSPSQAAHLSNHQRSTLRQIFQHPAGHNIEWRDVLSLLEAVGSAEEQHGGKVAVTIGSQTEYFDPPPHKDIDTHGRVTINERIEAGRREPRVLTLTRGRPGGWPGPHLGVVPFSPRPPD